MRIIARIIASPFVLALATIWTVYHISTIMYSYFLYGAELISHQKDDDKKIADIYKLLKKQYDANTE